MPRKRIGYRRRVFKKKAYRKRRGVKRRANVGNQFRVGFPATHIVKHRAVGAGVLTQVDGSSADFCDRFYVACNNLSNPFNQAAGSVVQPLGYDQWATLYESYVVLGAKMRVTFTFGEQGYSKPIIVGVRTIPFGNSSTPNYTDAPNDLIQQGNCQYRLISASQAAGSDTQKSIVAKWSAKKFFHVKDVKDNVSRIGVAGVDNNPLGGPADQASFDIFAGNYDNSPFFGDSDSIVTAHIVVDYVVLWSQPKNIPRSTQ